MVRALKVRHFGESPLVEDDSAKSPAYTTFDLQFGYQRPNAWLFAIDVFNLTGKKWDDIEYYYADLGMARVRPARTPRPFGRGGLVFPSTASTPLNKANVRKRVWMPLLKRAQVPYRDMYSLRWTFVSLARASGEAAFNVSRVVGHARSTIVDTIYAPTVDSALAGVSERVAERVGLTLPKPPAAPDPRTRRVSLRSSA